MVVLGIKKLSILIAILPDCLTLLKLEISVTESKEKYYFNFKQEHKELIVPVF